MNCHDTEFVYSEHADIQEPCLQTLAEDLSNRNQLWGKKALEYTSSLDDITDLKADLVKTWHKFDQEAGVIHTKLKSAENTNKEVINGNTYEISFRDAFPNFISKLSCTNAYLPADTPLDLRHGGHVRFGLILLKNSDI